MQVKLSIFRGMQPITDPLLIQTDQAEYCRDVDLRSGTLKAIMAPLPVRDIPKDTKTIYFWQDAEKWLTFPTVTHCVPSPLSADRYKRLYCTGTGDRPMMFYAIDGEEQAAVPIGLPGPTEKLTIDLADKDEGRWIRRWGYHWEESDGTKKHVTNHDSGITETVVIEAEQFTLNNLPSRPSDVSASASLILFFTAYSAGGTILGRIWPDSSKDASSSDLYINGFKVTSEQDGNTVKLTYDTTDIERYTTDRSYVFTWVDVLGQESSPSPPSDLLVVPPNKNVLISGLPTEYPHEGYAQVIAKRLYRTVTSEAGTEWQVIADIPAEEDSFLDSRPDEEALSSLPSASWDPPPSGLRGLLACAGGFFAGFAGKTVYFSAPAFPHAWPPEYAVSCDADIVGLETIGNTIYVFTDARPELIVATDPSMSERAAVAYSQGCVSPRSIIRAAGGVFFASPDGICQILGGDLLVLTSPLISKEQWRALQSDSSGLFCPEDTIFSMYDDVLFVFAKGGALTFDTARPELGIVYLSHRATAAHNVFEEDALYLASDGQLLQWAGGNTPLPWIWRSKMILFPSAYRFRRARVRHTGEATLRLLSASKQVYEITRQTEKSFLLPAMSRDAWWRVELTSQKDVLETVLSTNAVEM